MAWVENEVWEMEQGRDALLELRIFEDAAATTPWTFPNWDVKATISDEYGKTVQEVDVFVDTGIVRLFLAENVVNSLRTIETYRYDCLMIAPGNVDADDHYLATGPVTVALRTTRRDP